MAYVTPGTVAAGDVATAAAWNVVVNDVIDVDSRLRVFTNEAARDAAITVPTEGMICYLTAPTVPAATGTTTAVPTGIKTIHNGSSTPTYAANWVCVTPVGSLSNTAANTTSASYVTTLTGDATAISVTIVTGTSARIDMSGRFDCSAASAGFLTYSVSGATTIAALDANCAVCSVPSASFAGTLARSQIITNLTAGTNTFTLNYKTTAGTGTFTTRNLIITGIA
jgi:hypothetical protein